MALLWNLLLTSPSSLSIEAPPLLRLLLSCCDAWWAGWDDAVVWGATANDGNDWKGSQKQ